jgi:hypothetical protein
MKEPFLLGALSVEASPIAYLLILCDELQEWNRPAYGELDRAQVLPHSTAVEIGENFLNIHYKTSKGTMKSTFAEKKAQMLKTTLDIPAIFEQLNISKTTATEIFIENIRENEILPRPLLENLEQMAKSIHENYNKKQSGNVTAWDDLPDSLKFSNIRQAKATFEKLRLLGYSCSENVPDGHEEKTEFTKVEQEFLTAHEHERWLHEKLADGWKYAPEKDTVKKHSPYILPYDALPENMKELNRDMARNIFSLMHSIGMKVTFAREEEKHV